jgi:sarcosine oxidase subunit beta
MTDEGRSTDADDDWIASVVEMTRERVPALAGVPIDRDRCYAGLYEMSPDHHAIVGYASECENLFLVNGSSGHGVMHSPALGSIAADMICGNEPAIDADSLRPSRFADGKPIATSELL